jgi:hypothetical protein
MNPSAQDQSKLHETSKAAHTVEILVNTKPVKVPSEVTGAEIKAAAQVPADFTLFRVERDHEIPVGDDELLRVHHHEKFIASPTLDPAFVANPTHAAAIETVRDAFPGHVVHVEEPGDGTTVVTVRDIEVGAGWNVTRLDLAVKLEVTFPSSPPYPFYGPAGMARTDGRTLSQIQPQVPVDGVMWTQISLTKPYDPTVETLGARLVSVVGWLRNPR